MDDKKIVVVVPTRNRADLAINAINSVLTQEGVAAADIIVSDNSTESADVAKLSEFCRNLNNPLVHYIRPPKPLPMSDHWSWAMDKALSISQANYVTYLTDRIVLRPHSLKDLTHIISLYPEKVIAYSWDMIKDESIPVISFQLIRTGKVYEVTSQDLLDLGAESVFNFSLPRMMNSVCPRKTVEAVKAKFGRLFFTDNPDFNFAYTCLDTIDSILFYDFPLLISYGSGVSNGTTFFRGKFGQTDATKDFMETTKFNDIGEFVSKLPLSAVKHIAYEYDLAKQLSKSGKFKELDEDKLIRRLLGTVIFYEDKEQKSKSLRQVYSINKSRFLWNYAYTFLNSYRLRGITKLKSKMKSRNALDIMKSHQSLEEAMSEVLDTPRAVTGSRDHFDIRVGRFARELDITFKT
jgi:glycosyltransferase involved in cell wall biosynthesis